MDIEDIKQLLTQKEGHTLELKKSTAQIKGALETLCAFLNNQGGTVLIGINDKGEIIGQDISDATKQELANEVNKIEPLADVSIHYLPVTKNKEIIIFQVETGRHAPYVYDGRAFQRIESTTTKMKQHRYEQLLVKRGQLNHSWEEHLSSYEIDDLDHDEINKAVEDSIEAGRIPQEAKKFPIEDILNSWNLIESGRLVNAAAILFAKNVHPSYSQSHLKIGRFMGNKVTDDLADNRQYYDNAFHLFTEANYFISQNLPISSFFESDRYERIDKPIVPVLAIREALVNAICHRDYSTRAGYVAISIFNNRLEIWNNGNLPHNLKLDDLKKSHKSIPRNSRIANVFYDRHFFEGWGGGTLKMIDLCKEANVPEPQFEEYSGGFAVTFYYPDFMQHNTQLSVPQVSGLTNRQKEILNILAANELLSLREIVCLLKNPPASRTVGDDLAALKNKGLVQLKGTGKGARWFILDKQDNTANGAVMGR